MMLIHRDFSFKIEFEEGYVYSLVIENNSMFSKLVKELYNQINGYDGDFVLSEKFEPISITKKIEIVSEFIPFNANKKTLITKLHNKLNKTAYETDLYYETQTIKSALTCYIATLSETLGISTEYDEEIEISSLLKAANLKLSVSDGDLAESIIEYFIASYELEEEKIFVTVNLKSFLGKTEFENFIKTIVIHKIKLIMIDNYSRYTCDNEKKIIIDEDLCEIY